MVKVELYEKIIAGFLLIVNFVFVALAIVTTVPMGKEWFDSIKKKKGE